MNNQPKLLQFYFGSLSESERLTVEKDLLQDPEILLDYLDLKRKVEGATEVPQTPSPFLWSRLQPRIQKRRWYFAAAAGLIAASVLCFSFFQSAPPNTDLGDNGILFDSNSEHSFASDVM